MMNSRAWLTVISEGLAHPGLAVREGLALARGISCRIACHIRGVRFEAGSNLRIDGKLIVRGPGRVIFGDNARVGMTATPWTYAPDATIEIGNASFLNGTRFGYQREIKIGPRAILGQCSIMDTDFQLRRRQ